MEEVKANRELREGWCDRSGCRNRVTWRESNVSSQKQTRLKAR